MEWAKDGRSIYAIRTENDLRLTLVNVQVPGGRVTPIRDLGLSPPMNFPFLGLSLSGDGKSLLTSVPSLRGDLWILEGFDQN